MVEELWKVLSISEKTYHTGFLLALLLLEEGYFDRKDTAVTSGYGSSGIEVPIVTNEFIGVAMRKDMRLHILHGWRDSFLKHEESLLRV